MDESKKMTVFYKKRTLELDVMCQGIEGLHIYNMDIEDAELIYGYIICDYNEYLLRHRREFYLEKDENGELVVKMKEEYKKQAQIFF